MSQGVEETLARNARAWYTRYNPRDEELYFFLADGMKNYVHARIVSKVFGGVLVQICMLRVFPFRDLHVHILYK
jgi:hypothetical protein